MNEFPDFFIPSVAQVKAEPEATTKGLIRGWEAQDKVDQGVRGSEARKAAQGEAERHHAGHCFTVKTPYKALGRCAPVGCRTSPEDWQGESTPWNSPPVR